MSDVCLNFDPNIFEDVKCSVEDLYIYAYASYELIGEEFSMNSQN